MGRLAPGAAGEAARQAIHLGQARTARDLMGPTISVIAAETPITRAIGTVLAERRKILPVVDAAGRLIGVVDRSELLRAMHGGDRGSGVD